MKAGRIRNQSTALGFPATEEANPWTSCTKSALSSTDVPACLAKSRANGIRVGRPNKFLAQEIEEMAVEYDHIPEDHTAAAAVAALRAIFRDRTVARTVLDLGCGTGTWLRAAIDLGAERSLALTVWIFLKTPCMSPSDLYEPKTWRRP